MPYPYRVMPTAAVTHLGCKLNQSEAEALSLAFARAGYDIVAPADGPDVFVLNSCTVTHVVDNRGKMRRLDILGVPGGDVPAPPVITTFISPSSSRSAHHLGRSRASSR